MSTITEINAGSNFQHVRYDLKKLFLGDQKYIDQQTMINLSGGDLTYSIGTLLGRITATGKLIPVVAAAVDGSQYPVGLLSHEVTIVNTAETLVTVAIAGQVNQSLVVLNGAETLDTVVTDTGRTISDMILGETHGIYLRRVRDISENDNNL
jgi:hypothetical protein